MLRERVTFWARGVVCSVDESTIPNYNHPRSRVRRRIRLRVGIVEIAPDWACEQSVGYR